MGDTLQVLGIQWLKLIAQFINFGLVMLILWKWAYKPVFSQLEARRQKIAEGMANAEGLEAREQDAGAAVRRGVFGHGDSWVLSLAHTG